MRYTKSKVTHFFFQIFQINTVLLLTQNRETNCIHFMRLVILSLMLSSQKKKKNKTIK